MMTSTELASAPPDRPTLFTEQLRPAVAAYLARFKDSSREHTDSDLRCYLNWCADRGLDPLAARRPHLELYIRWMQEIRRFKPSTVSRRFSVTAGFFRTCVIDGVLEHSPAEHVRRPSVPPESATVGFTHLQFEGLLAAARESPNPCDFALAAMLGLLGMRIFEATGADIGDLGEERGHSRTAGSSPPGPRTRRWSARKTSSPCRASAPNATQRLPTTGGTCWANNRPAYRCRHGYSSAVTPDPARPKSLYVREDHIPPRLPAVHALLASENPPEGRRRRRTRHEVEVSRAVSERDVIGYLRARQVTLTYDPQAKTLQADTPQPPAAVISRAG